MSDVIGTDGLPVACPRIPTSKIFGMIPLSYIEKLEHNQLISSCCRHPENHDLEALFSPTANGVPDIYVFHCTCGRKHRRFCVGGGEPRPFWTVR